ncbi:MAG: phage Gp37/Gp68 family protein [Thermoanaerobaculia bacterium]
MSTKTAIEWTDSTWNPVRGCTKVSPGCKHCYAAVFSERFRGVPGHPFEQGFDLRLVPEKLEDPLRWKRPRRVFVNSMSDLFHERIPSAYIRSVFEVIGRAPQHQFQILTKRSERLLQLAENLPWHANLWMGVSVENARYTHRAVDLAKVPAAVRFLSVEPLLGPIPELPLEGIDWVVVGGESGHRHRPMRSEWAMEIRNQCQAKGVAFFFKQWGGRFPKSRGRELDGREWNQMPKALPPTDSGRISPR